MSPALEDVVSLVMDTDPECITDASGTDTLPRWDSMQQVVLMSMLEKTYGVALSADEFADLTTVGLIRAALAQRGIQ